jgi:hypothetical protein
MQWESIVLLERFVTLCHSMIYYRRREHMIVFINQIAHNIFQQFRFLTIFFIFLFFYKCNLHWNCPGIYLFSSILFFFFLLEIITSYCNQSCKTLLEDTIDSFFHHGFIIFHPLMLFSIHVTFCLHIFYQAFEDGVCVQELEQFQYPWCTFFLSFFLSFFLIFFFNSKKLM